MDNVHDFINLILLVGLAWLVIEMIRTSAEARTARKKKSSCANQKKDSS